MNNANISPQSPKANRNSQEFTGQLKFEQKVIDYLKKSEKGEVYYEIQEFSIGEKILGRRIFIEFYDSSEKHIHVFIPEELSEFEPLLTDNKILRELDYLYLKALSK